MPTEMALPGTHDRVLELLRDVHPQPDGVRVLDIGAGEGALSVRMKDAGFDVSACDMVAESFKIDDIPFRQADASGGLPFDDGSMDLAVAIEVAEHIDGHAGFFAEVSRVLAPGGRFMFTTPNILSLKSRLRFLRTGFFYSFDPLTPFTCDPVSQHISPFTINRYEWMLSQHDMVLERVATDKNQSSSIALGFLLPIIRLSTRMRYGSSELARRQNSGSALFGRKLVVIARRKSS